MVLVAGTCISQCGRYIALASAPHPITRSTLAAHQAFASLTNKDEFFKSISNTKRNITLGIYDTMTGAHIAHLNSVENQVIRIVKWSPDSKLLAVGACYR